MKRASWKKLDSGTLIEIPGKNGKYLIAQVLIPGINFYMQVYSAWVDRSDISSALKSNVLLIGETTDGELNREQWRICGAAECPKNFLQPYHVVDTPNGVVVCGFECQTLRQATEFDIKRYGYRVSVSSPVFSRAINDYEEFGLNADFGKIDARLVRMRCQSE